MRIFISITLALLPLFARGQHFDQAILQEIKDKAAQSHSDAVIIMQGDKVLYQDLFGKPEKPLYIASAGKSLTSLGIGKLLDKGLLDSLDQPVHTLFPEWKQGNKKNITVRMLLNHTSGLQNVPNASVEMEPAPTYKVANVLNLALAAELSDVPGTKVSYNNKAVALLGGIIEKASGLRMDEFFVREFYEPMNITEYDWIRDEAGNPTAHGAFLLKPSDLLKFGQMMMNKGLYQDKRIISEAWVDESLKQSQNQYPIWGLLWWRLPEFEHRIVDDSLVATWAKAGVDPAFITSMNPIRNQLFESKAAYYTAMEKLLGADWYQILTQKLPASVQHSKRIYGEKILAYYADGYRGNHIVMVPEHNLLAVRCADQVDFNYETDNFTDFVSLVARLGKEKKWNKSKSLNRKR